MKHKSEENAVDSSHNEIVIDLTKCEENPSPNRGNVISVFSIGMGSKEGKSAILNDLLKNMMSDPEELPNDGCSEEFEHIVENELHRPAPSRKRVKGSTDKE